MGSVTQTGLTGAGYFQLSGGSNVAVTDVVCMVTAISSAKVRQLGTDHPIGLRYAGLWMLGYDATLDSDGLGVVAMEHVIRFEKEDIQTYPQPFYVPSLMYRLAPGVEATIQVFW